MIVVATRGLNLTFGGSRERMTTLQLHLFNCLYLVVLVAVAFLAQPTLRRIEGALAGGAVSPLVSWLLRLVLR
jgi:hypothetical protein